MLRCLLFFLMDILFDGYLKGEVLFDFSLSLNNDIGRRLALDSARSKESLLFLKLNVPYDNI